jgi:hypothetical protein
MVLGTVYASKNYFCRSPFRSLTFDVSTGVLMIFVWWSLRAMRVQSAALQASAAIFGLMVLPVAVWIFSLLLHWEIRAVVDQTNETTAFPRLTEVHYSRLARLHWGLSLGVTVMSWGVSQALITAMAAHH